MAGINTFFFFLIFKLTYCEIQYVKGVSKESTKNVPFENIKSFEKFQGKVKNQISAMWSRNLANLVKQCLNDVKEVKILERIKPSSGISGVW